MLNRGTKLGVYEILSPLGAGGMGEVYRARDTKLNRDVALKFLSVSLGFSPAGADPSLCSGQALKVGATDPAAMTRFEREAKVLASLNHPNIAAIYGLEESNGVRALVMELVEGPTLAERIAAMHPLTRPASRDTLSSPAGRGQKASDSQPSPFGRGWPAGPGEGSPLAPDETLAIARQIAEALEYAHERGIIHRDLKPANVKITPDGAVKVLDFGLAKALAPEDSAADLSNSPTLSAAATRAGVIMGTAAYMSPEQAKAKPVDRRADIWAFGCVLYEMLSGKKAFDGETVSDVLAAVIMKDPDWTALPAWSPDGSIIAYARLDHSGLWDIWEVPALGGTPRRVILNAADPAWSPDGHSLAYENTANGALWVSGASGENAHRVAPAVAAGRRDTEPRFSPDGRQIAFAARTGGPHGELEVVDLASGKVRQVTRDGALALSPAWSADGRFIYFASSRGGTLNIWKIAASGGEPEQITAGQGDDAQLDVSSDGKEIVFSTWREDINIAQLDLEAKPGQQSVKSLTTDPARNQIAPVYSPDGKHIAYFSNLKGVEREGIWVSNADGSDPVQLVQDGRVNVFPEWTPDSQRLIYCSEPLFGGEDEYRVVPVSGGAPETLLKDAPDEYFDVGLDGRLLLLGAEDRVESFDPRDHKTETLGTLPAGEKLGPLRWSPDERSVAYMVRASRQDDPNAGLWVTDFKSPPRQLFRGWVDWYARGPGNEIDFIAGKPDLNGALWKVQWNGQGLTRTSITVPMIASYWVNPGQNTDDYFSVSPDGRHLAFDIQSVLGANIGMIRGVR